MGKAQFKDHFGSAIDGFDRILKNTKAAAPAPTLKEQIEMGRAIAAAKQKERTQVRDEEDRFIQVSPFFKHEHIR